MKVRKTILGGEHSDTLDGVAMVGLAYNLNGRWDDAEKLFVQVMETSKTKLGVDYPSTLMSMANLASTYRNQGRWDDAEELFVQVMETSKTKLGVDYPSTLTSMANLASTFWNQGRWDDAVGFHAIRHLACRLQYHPEEDIAIRHLAPSIECWYIWFSRIYS
jgi:tetratricopeptide (TPR) repeat protein